MMTTHISRTRLLASTIFCGAAVAATPALAQSSPDGEELIIVTGTRLAQPELSSATPLTVVGAEEIRASGVTRIEDLVNQLPQVLTGQNSNVSNGATGIATVDLRGLGAPRTLVLINGRRLVPGDPRTPVADLNFIPSAIVQRIDVLTGGASSVYGSDAVAGVVNFVMDTQFEGLRIDGQYGFYQHNNSGDERVLAANRARNFFPPEGNTIGGDQYEITAALGLVSPDGRGHLSLYAGYRSVSALLQRERDFSFCALQSQGGTANGFNCVGSGTTAPARLILLSPFLDRTVQPGGGLIPYNALRDAYNFGPLNYYQRPNERFSGGGFAEYEVSPAFRPFMEVMFMDDETNAQIAPSGNFLQQQNVNCDNPLLSAAQVATFCTGTGRGPTDNVPLLIGRRNVEGGGRNDDITHTSYRILVGAKGELSSAWNYEVYAQYGRTRTERVYQRDFSITRLSRSLQVVRDPATGQPVCKSFLDGTDPNCVPWNIFTGTTTVQPTVQQGVTQAALDYLQVPGFQIGEARQQVVSGYVAGNFGEYGFQLPWAERGFGLVVGAEYRDEFIQTRNDQAFQTGDLAGQGGPTVDVAGGFNVTEIFVEAELPLAEGKPGFDLLTLTAGYRYSDYSTAGTTHTYKAVGTWRPFPGLTLRGGYNRAVRAPNAVELFSPQSVGLWSGEDPCTGTTPIFTREQCARTGVPNSAYGTLLGNAAQQYNGFFGGNPDLKPEVADTFTAGVVFNPRFIRGFSITVDYFNVKIEDTISTVGASLILNQCGLTGNATLCSLVRRDPTSFSLWIDTNPADNFGYVVDTNVNIGSVKTSGVDISARYRFDFEDIGVNWGAGLSFDFDGTYLIDYTVEPGVISDGVSEYDCVGFYGAGTCGRPRPTWRHRFAANLTFPQGFQLGFRWRYMGNVINETTSSNPFLNGAVQLADRELGRFSWFDLNFGARITDRHSFRFGVNNILDKDPPIIGQQNTPAVVGNGNTMPGFYDTLGRYIYAGFTANF
jgi:outer membrane receptor protein involved in Fe transport